MLIAFVATLLAAEPLLHQHPLTARADSASATAGCVLCAAGVNRLPQAAPSVSAPQVVAYSVAAAVTMPLAVGVDVILPPRAPPAA